ncbi:MAG: AAA family ATPase, partial [Saprospiraceae bacterium]|nr:AAA family ATPase [Saprospiraceae bacterium]
EAQNLSQEGYLILAKSYMKEGNSEKARDIYQEAIILDPDLTDEELDNAFRVGAFEEFDLDDEMDDGTMEKPNINFSDVGGLEDVKREIDLKIIKPLAHADLYAQYGKKVGGGILLYGPPGCGKTYLSKATAGQIDAKFINVGLNDILDMWLGSSEQKLHNFFSLARKNTPCVLFFDEIDALGAKRSDMRQSAGKTVINQFLSELDGVETSNEGILIIGATNCPWHLDPAFRRPGRFDRIIFVPPPDTKGKEEILKILLKNKPTDQIDYLKVAKKTKDYSGADLEALIDIAIEKKLEKAIETGVPEPLRTADLLQAIDSHKPSTVDWFTTAKNYAMFANQSGLYDDILSYLNK